jgi:hypothetical protein
MQQTIKHTHRRIRRNTFRIAFQLPATHLDQPFTVWRIRKLDDLHTFRLEGLVLECTKKGGHAIVAHVIPGDVVMVTHHQRDGCTPRHLGFLVNDTMTPVALDDLSPYSVNQTVTDGPTIDFDGRRFLHFREGDLREFFRGKHPDWLQEHIDATLRLWRTAAPDLFARVAPACWLVRKPWFLAMYDPKRALEEFPHLVQGALGRYCIRRLTAPAPSILARLLPSSIKPARSSQNAEFLLDHHAADLTDDQLRACARRNPIAAIRHYETTVDSRRRAILLSCGFNVTWTMPTLLKREEFRGSIIDSLTEHADVWAQSHPQGLEGVLRMVWSRIPQHPTPDELIGMMARLEPGARQRVADFISSRI